LSNAPKPSDELDPLHVADGDLDVAFPLDVRLEQDEEWFVVEVDGEWRRLRLHDYAEIYSVPGLYERVVYDLLGCKSPEIVRDLLKDAWTEAGFDAADLTVLDLGAGNGCVAAELAKLGAKNFVGIDICPEAAPAAQRDRPGLYRDYVVADLTNLTDDAARRLDANKFNGLTCVAALGFGDIPPEVFAAAFNLLEDGAWVAFTIKSEFVEKEEATDFALLTRSMIERDVLDLATRHKFVHRVSLEGAPLHYTAFIGRKRADIPEELLAGAAASR
jgi:SAM-dependent methyltransferase